MFGSVAKNPNNCFIARRYHMMRSTAFPENQLRTKIADIVDIASKIESWVGVGVLVRSGR